MVRRSAEHEVLNMPVEAQQNGTMVSQKKK
jgi:hypothetical protein